MTDINGRLIRHLDRVVIRPGSTVHQTGHTHGDVVKVGRKWVHVAADSGRTVRVSPDDVWRL